MAKTKERPIEEAVARIEASRICLLGNLKFFFDAKKAIIRSSVGSGKGLKPAKRREDLT
jgi:hypothetical protein